MKIEMNGYQWVRICEMLRQHEKAEYERIRLTVDRNFNAVRNDSQIIEDLENRVMYEHEKLGRTK